MSTAYSPFEDSPSPQAEPAPPVATPTVLSTSEVNPSGVAQRTLICPECGQQAEVSMNRRLAADFCPRCDYPLFWTPSEVVMDPRGVGESLRRLPGAVGRQSIGSAACPHCAERNQITAEICVRCGGSMRLAPPPPPAVPTPAPPAPVVELPEPEPESDTFWWWVSAAAGIAMALLLALLLVRLLS